MLEDIKGVGPKNRELLNKLGIKNVDDLINFYPFRYNTYVKTPLQNGPVVISGIVESYPVATYIKKNLNKLSFRMETDSYLVNVTIFNRPFMKTNLIRGKNITVIGEYDEKHNNITATDIKFKDIDKETIEPVYHLTNGISSKVLNNLILNALDTNPTIIDYIPDYLKEKYEFEDKELSIRKIHNPSSLTTVEESVRRFKYEELFKFMFKINYLKIYSEKSVGVKRIASMDSVETFIRSLPFELTADQNSAVKDILNDLQSSKKMNRLVLGDVGSGKTIVAVIAMYYNYISGYQSAMLAPTEILATQHYYSLKRYYQEFGIELEILKGGMSSRERNNILKRLASGQIDILVSTHAVLEDDVKFSNLGLVITDEQHRFGVNQRSTFQNKGSMCDVLYMSATPIPRTYALTIYGDMDISIIKTKPAGRKEIKTSLVSFKDIKMVLSAMLEEIKLGHQVYIVCPLIVDENGETNLTSVTQLKSKLELAYSNKVPVEILHGKMKNDEKADIMNRFKEGKIRILISTTVIEVGVDVPNATVMVIFNAERFGLATIHQLRGRIGRNSLESQCIMISDKSAERLKILTESSDGFYISEMDYKLRGEGDLFGIRQSGDMLFKIADLRTDMPLLTQANVDSAEFIKNNHFSNYEGYTNFIELIDEIKGLD